MNNKQQDRAPNGSNFSPAAVAEDSPQAEVVWPQQTVTESSLTETRVADLMERNAQE